MTVLQDEDTEKVDFQCQDSALTFPHEHLFYGVLVVSYKVCKLQQRENKLVFLMQLRSGVNCKLCSHGKLECIIVYCAMC